MKPSVIAGFLGVVMLTGCSSSTVVDADEPKRLLGRESDVRLDAQMSRDTLAPGAGVGITYEIENLRSQPIAVADLLPESTFDPDTGTVTIAIGAEVPGNMMVPRLTLIGSGEKKSFTAAARLNIHEGLATDRAPRPRLVRLKLNFLTEVEPFRALIGIPERVIRDPKLADELFPRWVEMNDSVITNSVPITWGPAASPFPEKPRRF